MTSLSTYVVINFYFLEWCILIKSFGYGENFVFVVFNVSEVKLLCSSQTIYL